jgi:rhodanese-related sulfurtransferase
MSMPMGEVPARCSSWPQQPVVCFCHHGMRSAQVVAFLMHQGHRAVYNLEGGTDAWARQVDPTMPRY